MRFFLPVLFACACSREAPPPSEPPAPAAPQAPAEPGSPQATAESGSSQATAEPEVVNHDQRVRDLVKRAGTRPRCNDLTGCPMVGSLVVMGPDAAPAIARLYDESGGDDYWRLQLIEALGRIGAPSSASFLLKVAREDRLAPARVEALMALARMGKPEHRPAIESLVERLDPEQDRGVLLAAGYALAALGAQKQGAAIIAEHLVVPARTLRWDLLRPGVFAAGQLRLTDLRPRLEDILKRADPFVRREAAKALGAMRDRGAIEALIGALKDPIPGVRDEALRSLRTLTGARHPQTFEQWTRWWEREGKKSDAESPTAPRKR